MNGTYFQNPTFNSNQSSDLITSEQSYIENILRQNIGKKVKLFASFPDSKDYRDRIFNGIIKDAGKDHIIMFSEELQDWYLIPLIYLNWVELEEKLNFTNVYLNNNTLN